MLAATPGMLTLTLVLPWASLRDAPARTRLHGDTTPSTLRYDNWPRAAWRCHWALKEACIEVGEELSRFTCFNPSATDACFMGCTELFFPIESTRDRWHRIDSDGQMRACRKAADLQSQYMNRNMNRNGLSKHYRYRYCKSKDEERGVYLDGDLLCSTQD